MPNTPNRLSQLDMREPGANPYNAPSYVSARALAANTAESIAIPTGANMVRLAGNVDFYYSFSGAAAVPVDTDDGTASEMIKVNSNPEWRLIPTGATALSVIAAGIGIVSASFYTL